MLAALFPGKTPGNDVGMLFHCGLPSSILLCEFTGSHLNTRVARDIRRIYVTAKIGPDQKLCTSVRTQYVLQRNSQVFAGPQVQDPVKS